MSFVTISTIAITCIISFLGFNDNRFFDRYKFNTYAILNLKQIDRLLSSGFLHADFMHLLFNMFTLFFFAKVIITLLGNPLFVIIYLLSILGGNLFTLWMYRKDMAYSAIGASGGVSGILFASIALYPPLELMMLFIPIPIPGWVFAIGYLAYSTYGMKNSVGNIGHAAHLGGAIVGFASAIICDPTILSLYGYYLALIALPLIFLAYIVYRNK